MTPNDLERCKVKDNPYMFQGFPRDPNITPFRSTMNHSKILISFRFPIGHNVKFHSFFPFYLILNFRITVSKFYVNCLSGDIKTSPEKTDTRTRSSAVKIIFSSVHQMAPNGLEHYKVKSILYMIVALRFPISLCFALRLAISRIFAI